MCTMQAVLNITGTYKLCMQVLYAYSRVHIYII